jgi:hypothetical protein
MAQAFLCNISTDRRGCVRYGLDGACISHSPPLNSSGRAFCIATATRPVRSPSFSADAHVERNRQRRRCDLRSASTPTDGARHRTATQLKLGRPGLRLNLASGTAAALAHEINQPMTAARALARAVQQLLCGPVPDLARVSTNIVNSDCADRSRRRRGAAHARLLRRGQRIPAHGA